MDHTSYVDSGPLATPPIGAEGRYSHMRPFADCPHLIRNTVKTDVVARVSGTSASAS